MMTSIQPIQPVPEKPVKDTFEPVIKLLSWTPNIIVIIIILSLILYIAAALLLRHKTEHTGLLDSSYSLEDWRREPPPIPCPG